MNLSQLLRESKRECNLMDKYIELYILNIINIIYNKNNKTTKRMKYM